MLSDSMLYILAPIAGVLALLFAIVLAKRVTKVAPGNDRMVEIMGSIHEGAMAFLGRQYKTLIIFVICLAIIILAVGFITGNSADSMNPLTAVPFIVGAFCSILAGNIGMRIATKANARTANAAQESGLNKALSVAFSGGAVMGMCRELFCNRVKTKLKKFLFFNSIWEVRFVRFFMT